MNHSWDSYARLPVLNIAFVAVDNNLLLVVLSEPAAVVFDSQLSAVDNSSAAVVAWSGWVVGLPTGADAASARTGSRLHNRNGDICQLWDYRLYYCSWDTDKCVSCHDALLILVLRYKFLHEALIDSEPVGAFLRSA